jgi:Amino acid permease
MGAVARVVPAAPLASVERSRVERSKFRRELGRLDAVALLIAAIVVLDTVGTVARGGAQTITWLAIVAVLFFVPAGLAVAELGAAFPRQGGPYVWARLAFGRLVGSMVALVFFVEAPVWIGGSLAITVVAVTDKLIVPLRGGWRVLVALGFVCRHALLARPSRRARCRPSGGAGLSTGPGAAHGPARPASVVAGCGSPPSWPSSDRHGPCPRRPPRSAGRCARTAAPLPGRGRARQAELGGPMILAGCPARSSWRTCAAAQGLSAHGAAVATVRNDSQATQRHSATSAGSGRGSASTRANSTGQNSFSTTPSAATAR